MKKHTLFLPEQRFALSNLFLMILCCSPSAKVHQVNGFQVIQIPQASLQAKHQQRQWGENSPLQSKKSFVDVEFELSPEDPPPKKNKTSTPSSATASTTTRTTSKKKSTIRSSKTEKNYENQSPSDDSQSTAKSLFEMSLEQSDLDWKAVRIPFIDTTQNSVIDGTLAFMVDLEGVGYGIATPCDYAAAIAVEETDGTVTNLYPENDDNEELMHIMATQLSKHVGEDLVLKRTPRVLTIQGDLGQYTKNWELELLPKPFPADHFLDDRDEDLDFFHEFMKKELGQAEYDKTMAEAMTAEDIGDELMELFDVPGLGERKDDTEGLEELLRSLVEGKDPEEMFGGLGENLLDHPGAALKLVSYHFKNGKTYSLVQLLKPYTLVGRLNGDVKDSIQFELLSREEEKVVIPKLEQVCEEDLKRAGLSPPLLSA